MTIQKNIQKILISVFFTILLAGALLSCYLLDPAINELFIKQ